MPLAPPLPPLLRLPLVPRRRALATIAASAWALCGPRRGYAAQTRDEVQVAVAANFGPPMARIATAFEQATGHRVLVSVGSTGRFYAQVRNGAPFQLLLAADAVVPAKLEAEGHSVPGSRWTYAIGRLVLWSAQSGLKIDGPAAFDAIPGRVAVADPRLAPYGAAAYEAMERLGLLGRLRSRLVQGESIAQAYQFVASGNATLGWVARAQVTEQGKLARGSGWLLPANLHRPIQQDALLLRRGQDSPAAQALLAFLRSEAARAIIRDHGYE